ncbi:MAG: hypothetical protein KatS3mg119_1995 [Rhodothalassiaceae bacterium]|nr:MAG: hypothetical protein KatS3mg119_1995 [Rhodothalassiaceae bacterium]
MTTAVATLDRNLAGATTATPVIRELTMEECEEVKGGVAPIVVYGAIAIVGAVVGYFVGRDTAESQATATATAHDGTVECNCQCGANSQSNSN